MRTTSPETELQAFIEPGERLLWCGIPRGGIRFRSQDIFLVPFSIAWCVFAVFWTYTATKSGAPAFFTLWGLMFVCFGLFFVFGRFVADAKKRRNTSYAVTDHRVLIYSGIRARELKSLNLRAIPEISLVQHSDGSGTISFGVSPFGAFGGFRGWPGSEKVVSPAFEFIENAPEVHRLVLAQQKSA
jgi:hypothetical protein